MIQSNYPGLNLPPLWQVIYQEAVRGHHLLFRKVDIERFTPTGVVFADGSTGDFDLVLFATG